MKKIVSLLILLFCLTLMPLTAQAAPQVILDGQRIDFDVQPVIENGRTLVPLRAIFEALGANVQWEGSTQTVTATKNGTEIKLIIGGQAFKNGQTVNLDVPAKIVSGRTMVPLRFVSEALGARVNWNGATQTIAISSSGQKISSSTNKGVDRSKFKGKGNGYPVTLYIGNLSFNGSLSRMNTATDQEIEQAIKEALDEMGLNELDIGDAEKLVEQVASDEVFTDEDMKEVRDNILKLAGVDTFVDVMEYVLGGGDKSASDIALDAAMDKAKEKALEIALEGVGEGAGGVVSTLFDTAVISADQYAKDKEKWKNRAASALAQETLKEFYDKVNEKLGNRAGQRFKGWVLNIEDSASRNFTFYTIEGNLETWNVNVNLKKPDSGDTDGPSGTYTGIVQITVEYEMSAFDQNFKDWGINKSGYHDAVYNSFQQIGNVDMKHTDDYLPTHLYRNLDSTDYSVYLPVPVGKGQTTKTKIDFSGFSDAKEINISHKLTTTANVSGGDFKIIHKYTVNYKSDGEEQINVSTVSNTIVNGESHTVEDRETLDWDPGVWEQWEKEKWLEISYP